MIAEVRERKPAVFAARAQVFKANPQMVSSIMEGGGFGTELSYEIWVAVPGRKIVSSVDYFQGFLPNAGNGKRRQRYPEEWARPLPSTRRFRADCPPWPRCWTASPGRWWQA